MTDSNGGTRVKRARKSLGATVAGDAQVGAYALAAAAHPEVFDMPPTADHAIRGQLEGRLKAFRDRQERDLDALGALVALICSDVSRHPRQGELTSSRQARLIGEYVQLAASEKRTAGRQSKADLYLGLWYELYRRGEAAFPLAGDCPAKRIAELAAVKGMATDTKRVADTLQRYRQKLRTLNPRSNTPS